MAEKITGRIIGQRRGKRQNKINPAECTFEFGSVYIDNNPDPKVLIRTIDAGGCVPIVGLFEISEAESALSYLTDAIKEAKILRHQNILNDV